MLRYADRFVHAGAGDQWDDIVYQDGTYDAFIWQFQRELVSRVAREAGSDSPARYLDFACGTGRVLSAVQPLVGEAWGIDVSPAMLGRAQAKAADAHLECLDILAEPERAPGDFDVITAFRFFLNADPPLRQPIMTALAERLRDGDSRLVFNIHANSWSVARYARRSGLPPPLSPREVRDLVRESGLRIEEWHGFGVTPRRLHATPLRRLARWIDRGARHIGLLKWCSTDVVFVCRRA